MAEADANLLRHFPLLLPQNREKTVYEGFISAQGSDFHLKIVLPKDLQLKKARLLCSWQLKNILNEYHQIVQQSKRLEAVEYQISEIFILCYKRMKHSPDLMSFMMELKMILEGALKNRQELCVQPPSHSFCTDLLNEIGAVGWDKLACVDPSFSTIKLKADDASGRKHLITVKLKAKYPVEPPDCVVDFPVPFSVSWTPQGIWTFTGLGFFVNIDGLGIFIALLLWACFITSFRVELLDHKSSLVNVYSQFVAALETLKTFWDAMDEIDEKTWVLEPEKPPRSATARRIVLGTNVSINIEVDPRHPAMLPEVCFLGPDHVIKPLGIKLSGNIHLWDPENSLLQNLKDVLEIDFPARTILEESDFSMDCGICYARHLNGSIPDQVCDNPQCGQPFHQMCLYEWLRGLSTSRQSFNVLFGECPYCSKPITLKMSGRKP